MKSIGDAKGVLGTLELIGAELKKRLLPVMIIRNVQSMLPLLNTGCRRDAMVLLRALHDVDESVVRAAAALKTLQKSIDRDVKRLQAIEHDELVKKAKEDEAKRNRTGH